MSEEKKGKIVVVTGGSRGIGRAISVALAKGGHNIVVNYTTGAGPAEETVALCIEAGGKAEAVQCDVSNSEQVDALFDGVKERLGSVDILVNNAGIARDGLFVRLKDKDWDDTLNTNLKGSFYCARAASRQMIRTRWGRIINISSVVGEMGNAGQVAYVSSKAGVIGMTKALARELASRNITVNSITPGFIDTDMTSRLDEKVKSGHLAQIPLSRYGSPDDVANLVAFLAGDGAGYITGQVIGVNGGLYM